MSTHDLIGRSGPIMQMEYVVGDIRALIAMSFTAR
jgi:hypothetical protein